MLINRCFIPEINSFHVISMLLVIFVIILLGRTRVIAIRLIIAILKTLAFDKKTHLL